MSDEKIDQTNELEGHNYDGISELDNPLPTWWLWTFFFTFLFSFLYYLHYEISQSGPTLKEELNIALEEMKKNQSQDSGLYETEASLVELMNKPELVGLGGSVYANKCAVCHGDQLQGQIGPNLTDHYWIHGQGKPKDILKVIRDGVSDKGMPGWNQLLNTDDQYAVTAFILYKIDSNPVNAKPPQGSFVEN